MTEAAPGNGQGPPRPPEAAPVLRLRPGANIFHVSPDELQIAFPNYTVSFTSPEVVRVVAALVESLRGGEERGAAVAAAVAETGSSDAFVDYLVTLLANSRCLYDGEGGDAGPDRLPVEEFHAYLGDDPARVRSLLAARPVVLLAPEPMDVVGALAATAGLHIVPVPLVSGSTCGSVLAAAKEGLDGGAMALACWNVAYRLPLARLVNELAIERGVGVLFGACEGVVGRIGPYVLPGNSACLECANLRLLSHAGTSELRAQLQYRVRYDDLVPEPWPAHPLFVSSVAGLFLLELAQIVAQQPPQTLGAFIEHVYPGGMAERHPVHRVPSCPSCHPATPRRLAWDVRFPAPAMKTSAE